MLPSPAAGGRTSKTVLDLSQSVAKPSAIWYSRARVNHLDQRQNQRNRPARTIKPGF